MSFNLLLAHSRLHVSKAPAKLQAVKKVTAGLSRRPGPADGNNWLDRKKLKLPGKRAEGERERRTVILEATGESQGTLAGLGKDHRAFSVVPDVYSFMVYIMFCRHICPGK